MMSIKKRRAFVIRSLVVALTFALVGVTTPGATAKGPNTGVGAFALTCHLPQFPSPGNTATCSGTGAMTTAFVDNKGDPGVFIGAGSAQTKKSPYYSPCTAGEPLIGSAGGSVQLSGSWIATKDGTGHPATIWMPFNWQRIGVVAIVTMGKLSGAGQSTITDQVTGQTVSDAVGGVAVAAFVPLGVPGNCSSPAPLDVLIPAIDFEIA